jgi:hypothetical protein
MSSIVNLLVIAAVGVIIADLVHNSDGTKAIFNGVSSIWTTSVNGMLGNATGGTSTKAQTTQPTQTI